MYVNTIMPGGHGLFATNGHCFHWCAVRARRAGNRGIRSRNGAENAGSILTRSNSMADGASRPADGGSFQLPRFLEALDMYVDTIMPGGHHPFATNDHCFHRCVVRAAGARNR